MIDIFFQTIESKLFFWELAHILVGLVFGYFLWIKTKSRQLALLTVFFSVFIDVDHLLDYFLVYGLHFDLGMFLSGTQFDVAGKALVLLHSWESLVIGFVFVKAKGFNNHASAYTLGLCGHLIVDCISVNSIIYYSLIYRVFHLWI